MRPFLVIAAVALFTTGYGSSTGDPVSACQALASAGCNALSDSRELKGVTVLQCTVESEALNSCSTAKCPTGITFDSSAAAGCVEAVRNEDCNDLGSFTPPACRDICL